MNKIRITVYELLKKVSYDSAFSNLTLNSALNNIGITDKEKAVISRIFYGVIERKITLEYIISMYSSKPLQKLDKEVVLILCIGLYQLKYMDSIPDNVVVNESVELIKQKGKNSAAGFINAVLRSFIRDDKIIKDAGNELDNLSLQYSCPVTLIKKWMTDYDKSDVLSLLQASVKPNDITARVNNTKTSCDELISKFEKESVFASKCSLLDNCIKLRNSGSIEKSPLYIEGYFHIQDISSQLCCMALNVSKDDSILDICAAPGGKTFTLAEMTGGNCNITACDLHQKRVDLIKNGAERLGLTNIKAIQNDAKVYKEDLGLFDKVLCDVPCSGFGVIRSKPEIKYKSLKDIRNLPEIQYNILKTASRYLKVGGELVYSTCSVNRDENDNVIDRFLNEFPEFCGVNFLDDIGKPFGEYKATIFPCDFDSDGFFVSKIKKVR